MASRAEVLELVVPNLIGPPQLKYFRDGLAISDSLAEANPNHSGLQASLATSYGSIALVLVEQGDTAGALDAFQHARQIVVRIKSLSPDAAPLYALFEAAIIKLEVALNLTQKHEKAGAVTAFQQAREIIVKLREQSPNDETLLALFDAAIARREKALTTELGVVKPAHLDQ